MQISKAAISSVSGLHNKVILVRIYVNRIQRFNAVFEIKGAHFGGQVHRFWKLCTQHMHFFFSNIQHVYVEACSRENYRETIF